jgi:hypothetical protein
MEAGENYIDCINFLMETFDSSATGLCEDDVTYLDLSLIDSEKGNKRIGKICTRVFIDPNSQKDCEFYVELIRVSKPYLKYGYGSLMMELLTQACDLHSCKITLDPIAQDNLIPQDILEKWYGRFGFRKGISKRRHTTYSKTELIRLPRRYP